MPDPTRLLLVLLALLSVLASAEVPRHTAERQVVAACAALRTALASQAAPRPAAPSRPLSAISATAMPRPPGRSMVRHRSRGPPWA